MTASPMNFSTTPPVAVDGVLPAGEARVDHGPGVLGVQPPRQDGEVDQVGEEDGDQPALLAELSRDQLGVPLSQRRQRGLDDVVTEDGSLALQRRDGPLDGGEVTAGRGTRRRRHRTGRAHAAYGRSRFP